MEQYEQLCRESGEQDCFTAEKREEIDKGITEWEKFHDSRLQTRKPSDLRVCYLAGDNPINDLEVFVKNGILCQNVWAIEKDAKTLDKACENISQSAMKNVQLFKGDFLACMKDLEEQFDIIYFDACGTLPSVKQNTLKAIGYVFLEDKLASPGALITNFSFPPVPTVPTNSAKQWEDEQETFLIQSHLTVIMESVDTFNESIKPKDQDERENLRHLIETYLEYRLENTRYPKNLYDNASDEEKYSDYVTFQVIDLAYLFTPVFRMLGRPGSNIDEESK